MVSAKVRLSKELQLMTRSPVPLIRAKPLEKDIHEWHYVIEGTPDSPYQGGWYHGVLTFPHEYPLKPPSVKMSTPSGRFKPNERLCLSISDYHPESWNPSWGVEKILLGLQSFMQDSEITAGSIETTDAQKRAFAASSLDYNVKNDKNFCKLFPELVELHKTLSAGGAAAGASSSAAGSGSIKG